ncbi:MAG: hypothetical protein KJN61_06815 [Gammaproteobacteria bacterium]|nr:hypothetical protein [Gammaproteobacteria bacterium]NNK97625.1 hypothetical protein [Xanthomonadales bacterium]
MFSIEMLPAAHGDCLWIEYGDGADNRRILIDGGPAHTYPSLRDRILHLPEEERQFELLMVTHVDGDHIEGVVRLLQDAEALKCKFKRIWFNGRDQLNAVPDPAGEPLGALQGEYLGVLIADYEARTGEQVWNKDFDNGIVGIIPQSASLPAVTLDGACRLTLFSPTFERLLELKDRWRDELRKAGVVSGDEQTLRRKLEGNRQLRPLGDVLGEEDDFEDAPSELPSPAGRFAPLDDVLGGEAGADAEFGGDGSKANGSSIAVLLEYPAADPDVRVLLAGDAWAQVLEASIDQYLDNRRSTLKLDAFKIPHHGSVANITASLLGKIKCKHYLVSTSGAKFDHPHARAIELILDEHLHRANARLNFNYLTRTTEAWCDDADQRARRYHANYPKGLSVEI